MSKKGLIIAVIVLVVGYFGFTMYRDHQKQTLQSHAAAKTTPKPTPKPATPAANQPAGPAVDPKNLALIQHYTDLITKSPNDPTAYYERALVYQKMQRYDLAILDFDTTIKLTPSSPNAFFSRGLTFYEERNLGAALNDYNDAIKLKANDPHMFNARGLVYMLQQNLDQALVDFNQALTLDSNYGSAYFNRGTVYEQQQNYPLATADYSNAIKNNKAEIENEDPAAVTKRLLEAYYRRGIVELNNNQIDAAMKDVNYVIAQDPKDASAFKLRAAIYDRQGNTAAAAADTATADNLGIENMMHKQ